MNWSGTLKDKVNSWAGSRAYKQLRTGYYAVARAGRIVTSHLRALPDFIIVGAQKSGTSSLYKYLLSHPNVMGVHGYRPDGRTTWGKEIHYFDDNFDKPEWWYRFHFPLEAHLAKRSAITGEASPQYLYHPHVPERIASMVPKAKIVICLRNPVDRAVSSYWHYVRKGIEDLSMRQAFENEKERIRIDKIRLSKDEFYFGYKHKHLSYLDKGIYADQVKRYLDHFDRSRVLILRAERLFDETQFAVNEVISFLELEHRQLDVSRKYNTGSYRSEIEADVRARLEEYYKPHNERLFELLEVESAWW